ncbi:IS3 family transposase [Oscillibacter sp. 1-3]|uniref:IS3 family transposase n=1 Tax=Oscillibacter sp. 1-3 TaxID=1235797 RepID=UPI000685F37B|nr:IS3 family transposase [Oscillibacter sp. 1-3]
MIEYQIIQQLHEEQGWPLYKLCEAVDVSRAAYYKWEKRVVSQKQSDTEKLAALISGIYQSRHGIADYRQMKLIMERRYGIKRNLKRVYCIIRILGLHS